MAIDQITTSNTFGQLITATAALIAVANNFTDGPQSQTGSTWTFTNANVGVNVTGTLLSTTANLGTLNLSTANVSNAIFGRANISTANVTTANVVGATIITLNATQVTTGNANISGLLQVSDRANIFSANIESANLGTTFITSLSVASLTVPVLNASFANITTLSVTGTSQHNALIATLLTTANANVGILNASTANITNETVGTSNISVANITNLTVGTQNISSANITTGTFTTLNASFANITSANITTVNIAQANIVQMTGTTITVMNVSSANLTTITSNTSMSFNPTANLGIATKNYADTGAGGNVVWKNTFSAKGDLPAGTGVNTFSIITSGSNGQSLVVDTQTSSGLRWAARGPAQTFRNLSLQTSAADKIANGTQIVLDRAEEITMDDGETVIGWPEKTVIVNTANTGNIGGLDTGTLLANTWYELHAIRKRSDGTKGFILHRALDRNVDQNTSNSVQFAQNITVQVNRVTLPNVRVAQSFVATVSGPLTSFEVRAFKTGTPTGNVWIQLHANTAGDPGASALAISRRYDVARMALTPHYPIRFVFDVTANVVATTSYFAVAQTDFTASDTSHITLQGSATAYTNGVVKGNTGASWVALAPGVGTLIFKEYVEANSTALVFPAGYDQRCLVGYTATDQASRLREFTQRDRTISTFFSSQWMGFATLGTEKEVADLTTVLPPVQCMVQFLFFGTTTAQSMTIGRLHAIDLVTTVAEGLGGFIWATSGAGTIAMVPTPPFWIEHQAMNIRVQTVTKVYPVTITF